MAIKGELILIKYILKSGIRMILLILAISIAAFFLMTISPIDPLQTNVGQTALGIMSQEQIEQLQMYWGTNENVVERYLTWIKDFIFGDMGTSLLYRQPVHDVIVQRLFNSMGILLCAWLLSGIFGVILGMLAGANEGSIVDTSIKGIAILFSSTPVFWFALIVLLLFSVWLKWFPIGFSVPIGVMAENVSLLDKIHHGVLPTFVLSIAGMPNIILHTREKMSNVLKSDYILFARALGKTKKQILWQHGLRNVLLPAITLQFASISEIFSGSILAEQVFSYPGLGQIAVTAGLGGDMPLLLAVVVIYACFVCGGNFLADIIYHIIDPRIQVKGKQL